MEEIFFAAGLSNRPTVPCTMSQAFFDHRHKQEEVSTFFFKLETDVAKPVEFSTAPRKQWWFKVKRM